jgi:hypothetical protein
MYLVKGDEVTALEFRVVKGVEYVKFRFYGKKIIEGWLRCDEASQCGYVK